MLKNTNKYKYKIKRCFNLIKIPKLIINITNIYDFKSKNFKKRTLCSLYDFIRTRCFLDILLNIILNKINIKTDKKICILKIL